MDEERHRKRYLIVNRKGETKGYGVLADIVEIHHIGVKWVNLGTKVRTVAFFSGPLSFIQLKADQGWPNDMIRIFE